MALGANTSYPPEVNEEPFALFSKPRRTAAALPPPAEEDPWGSLGTRGLLIADGSQLLPLDPAAPFKSLGLNEWLARAPVALSAPHADPPPQAGNCRTLGLSHPTPVQHACIPVVLAGRDVIGLAQTGSGKTAAFALPTLQRLSADPYGVFALVLTPTRELALQIGEQFVALAAGFALRCTVCIGGEDFGRQASELARRPHVVVATPGRLREQLWAHEAARESLRRAAVLVLDEADRLLEPSFEPELAAVLACLPVRRQTLLFSATLTPAVEQLQRVGGAGAYRFAVGGADGDGAAMRLPAGLRQQLVLVPAKVKEVYLAHLLSAEQLSARHVRSALLFAPTVRSCQLLADTLAELGLQPAVLHSAMAQKQRGAALARFRGGAASLLVATDVASRGLDVPTVDLVLNFDVPAAAEDYVHRCGRTARAGRGGLAITLVTQYDVVRVEALEAATGVPLEPLALDEAEVLKGMTRVMVARRTASLKSAPCQAPLPCMHRCSRARPVSEPGGMGEKLAAIKSSRAAGTARRAAGGSGGRVGE